MLAASAAMSLAAGATIDITTNGSTPWTVSVPSQSINNATPNSGYLSNSITPFTGGGNCTHSPCDTIFDGFWTAGMNFTLPANATNIVLDFSGLTADDRTVFELNGSIIGDGLTSSSAQNGSMTFTDGGPNQPYSFGGAASESGSVTTGFNAGGSNTLLLIVNNTQGGAFGPLTGFGFTAAGVSGSITYDLSFPVSAAPEPAPFAPVAACLALMPVILLIRRRARGASESKQNCTRFDAV